MSADKLYRPRRLDWFRTALAALVGGGMLATGPASAEPGQQVDLGEPFGSLRLIDEVNAAETTHDFTEAPAGVSVVQTILGRPARVLPNEGEARYFAYRLGVGKGLEPGKPYVLEVEYPEDQPRSMFISNRGCETTRGFRTGRALGDVLYTYTDNNSESLDVPLAGEYRRWHMLFFLHDRFPDLNLPRGNDKERPVQPEEGFWVVIPQSKAINDPISHGAAISHIRLYAVDDFDKLIQPLRLPPANLPRRHITWREEMADGVVGSTKPQERGFDDPNDWFEHKLRLMQFLGMNTFGKDLLEFGHNQGWDASQYGGNAWYWASNQPERWERMLDTVARYDGIDVMPYYEWVGGVGQQGLGRQKRARSLANEDTYTHIKWSERFNVDITDPDTLQDARNLLDATILRYKDKVSFVGAWFRTRPSHIPISFADATLQRFAVGGNEGVAVTREQLRRDESLRQRYYAWWFDQRKAFLLALRDYLRENGVDDAVILFTADSGEPAPSLHGGKQLVTDDVNRWRSLLTGPDHQRVRPVPFDEVVSQRRHYEALTRMRATWGQWEWHHSVPSADPANYTDVDGVLMTFAFQTLYSVSDPAAFEAFRTARGLATVRHYPLNENTMHEDLGYFVSDVDRSGKYSMIEEARTVAYGDPRYLAYLAAASYNRGFPHYTRKFNAAFLSLPALPSQIVPRGASHADVVVRRIDAGEHGTWLAVVNVGLQDVPNVTIQLPHAGAVTDAATGEALPTEGRAVRFPMHAAELRAIHIAR